MNRSRRFPTKRLWYNTKAWAYVSVAVILASLVMAVLLRVLPLAYVGLGVSLLGFGLALLRDKGSSGAYIVTEDNLLLAYGSDHQQVSRAEFIDASLVDRAAARDYIRQVTEGIEDGARARSRERDFVRFCSVDIGLSSFTFGLGRQLIDRLPRSKDDLVLLRLRGDRQLLLSPVYNQDLVDSLTLWSAAGSSGDRS